MADGTAVAARRVGFSDVFRVAEFRRMWCGEIASIAGDQLARVALSVLVYGQTRSALLTGLSYALTYAPSLLGGILLTPLADRLPRREVMVATDLVRALLVAAVALPGTPLWLMWTLVAGVSLLNPVFKSAQLALLPQVLAGDRFPVGMALRNITTQSAQLAGFAGGGLLVAALSPRAALALDAATFLASAALIRFGVARRPAAATTSDGRRPSWLASIGRGGRTAFGSVRLRTLILFTWLAGLPPVYEGIAAPYAATVHGGATAVGLLLAADPLGSAVGAFAYARWVPAAVRPRLIGPLAVLSAVPLLGCFARPGLAVSVVLFVLTGGLGTVALMQATASLTVAVPDGVRSSVMGLSNTGLTTVMGLTPLLGGLLAGIVGPSPTVALVGVAALLLTVPLAWAWHRAGPAAAP